MPAVIIADLELFPVRRMVHVYTQANVLKATKIPTATALNIIKH